ncbi:unnamed protein product [Miscanthus lutarioriparius]|uniref:Sacsin n=1 Tax=Miscanthus lutarioriparius TaxID=422564 RepID=A0A811QLB1_9POAL|nr:unnamed protein product [Miscanthus lutarioriparius]
MPPPASPREHMERIRRERYYIGRGEQNPLTEDMHQAVNYLSQELYSKDVHFLMELVQNKNTNPWKLGNVCGHLIYISLQNAEDNEYPSEVAPSLEFLITSKDITGCGASSTLLIFNNERGFSATNIESICRVGKSTKKGNRHQGYIGEKGIGFKSVFLISNQPHIFSNGYQIKFNEKPCAECNIVYIVPQWVESTPSLSDIEALYGCSKILPTTIIILPLKSEKIDAVKRQLSSMHPEMLLFLTKIRKLSVREDNSDPSNTTVSEIPISSEKNYQARKNMHAESYTLHLSAEETGKDEAECGYYMWRQKFPVKPENRVDKRAEIDEWVITLAFPHGERLSRGKQLSPGIYAFLPTEMVTSFPFIIQADFLLASSREAILFDSPWNKGILECVPSAFMDAFVTLIKSGADASPSMSLPSMFNFLPVNSSQIPLLETVRSGIKDKVLAEAIVLYNWQNFSGTNMLSIPLLKYVDRGGVLSFWSISRASQWNDRLCIASENKYISWLISWNKEFLSSNRFFLPPNTQTALEDLSEKITVKNWLQNHARVEMLHIESYFSSELCRTMPVIDSYGYVVKKRNRIIVPAKGSKWVGLMGTNPWRNEGYIELSADYKSAGHFAGNYTPEGQLLEFLKTNLEASDVPFIHPPDARFPTVSSPLTVNNAFLLLEWIRNLKSSGVRLPDLFLTCVKEGSWLKTSAGYKSPNISFLSSSNWGSLLQTEPSCVDIPMIDQQHYQNKLHMYKEELKAIGVRFEFQEASAYIGSHLMSIAAGNSLTRENVYTLLRLIRFLREKFLSPSELIKSVKEGRWMKSTLGYRRPADCIIYDSDWAVASCISNQPFVDVLSYGAAILEYKPELELLGVIVGFKDNYQLVIDNFKFSSDDITSEATVLILKCIRYVGSYDDFIRKLKDLKWLKTIVGFHAPNMSFLVDPEWECLLKVFNGVPVIDYGFYGSVISSYKEELKKTGLITRFDDASKAITHIFKQKVLNSSLEKADLLALLGSYRQLATHDLIPVELFNAMRTEKWLTSLGFRSPSDAILFDDAWEPLSPIANLPFIDDGDSCYGLGMEIHGYKDELKKLGVTVELKQGARFVITGISIPSDPSKLSKATILSLLGCIKSYFTLAAGPPKGFQENLCKKWLKTSMGYQCPNDCILFDPTQSSICMEDGPFIDEAFYGSEVASFKDALTRIGVTVDIKQGKDLVARHLRSHNDRITISRIYSYLMESNWLHVLDKYYDKNLLDFFLYYLDVRNGPGSEDYCRLWVTWEKSVQEIAVSDCSAFWKFIATNCSKNTQKLLSGCVKVPVCTDGKIILSKKEDVFIPDDLLLTDLFSKLAQHSFFIWYPASILPSMSRASLNCIYDSIGVQRISKAVTKNDAFTLDNYHFRTTDPSEVIKVGLLKIILSFLADPALNIPAEERHRMVSCLLNVTVQESDEPITVGYSVRLSSGEVVDVKSSRMLRWEREDSKLYMQSSDGEPSYKEKIEFATYFAEEISQGLLFEMADQIPSLAELIKFGSLLDFEDAAVGFLLKSKNLQVFPEDEHFLKSLMLGHYRACTVMLGQVYQRMKRSRD